MGSVSAARLATFLAAGLACIPAFARTSASAQDSSKPTAPAADCGASLAGPAHSEWLTLGGADGRLGCPTGAASEAPPSPAGTRGSLIPFGLRGGIALPASGANAGLAFAVAGCAWTLWQQYGGPGGWLGLPLEEAQNTPDGQTQKFEGGTIVFTRAYDSCEARRPGDG